MEKPNRTDTKKILIAVSLLLAVVLLIFLCIPRNPDNTKATVSTDPTATNTIQTPQKELRFPDLLGTAKTIKSNFLSSLNHLKQNELETARQKLDATLRDINAVQTYLAQRQFFISLIPQSKSILELLDAADMGCSEVLLPAIDLLETHPISEFSVGDGFNVMLLSAYLDFAESVMPKLERLMKATTSVDLSLLDSVGKNLKYLEPVASILDIYHEDPAIFPRLNLCLARRKTGSI